MIVQFFDMLAGTVFSVLNFVIVSLPSMPFGTSDLNSYMSNNMVLTVISWVNYFIPVQAATAIVAAWATAMTTYVGVKLSIKYAKVFR